MNARLRMMCNRFRCSGHENGQAGIELLLAAPAFIFVVLFAVDVGLWMYQWVSVSNAVREGARFGAVNCASASGGCTEALVQARAIERSGGVLSASDCIEVGWVDRNSDSGNGGKGDSVVVNIKHTYSFLFLPGVSAPVVSSADMRLEQRDDAASLPAPAICP